MEAQLHGASVFGSAPLSMAESSMRSVCIHFDLDDKEVLSRVSVTVEN
jgi:hypothetical protein